MLSYVFKDQNTAYSVLAPNDSNLAYLELLLGYEIICKGNQVIASRDDDIFFSLFKRLEKDAEKKGNLNEADILLAYEEIKKEIPDDDNAIVVAQKTVWPKSVKQKEYIRKLKEDDVVIALGPAGTGKTFLAISYALSEVLSGRKKKIVLTRPVVEAGESLGFLPGDLMAKLSPYLRPLYDAMEVFLPLKEIRRLEDNGEIEISPLAYMRGRSIRDSIVILDEAQNATKTQMKMFLTRLGEKSKAIVAGDPTQIDLPNKNSSGLLDASKKLVGINGLGIVEFTSKDAQRSRIVRDILYAYEKEAESEES